MLSLAAVVLVFVALARSQNDPRPPLPAGGFGVVVEEDFQSVQYSDGSVTMASLFVPDHPQIPVPGWPLVVFVHQLGDTRFSPGDLHAQLVATGIAVLAYDVRGQGAFVPGAGVEPGTSLYGPDELMDLGEQIQQVCTRHPSLIDSTRLSVAGFSQGGVHAWMAAAWSGRTVEAPGRPSLVFPEITAVCAAVYVPVALSSQIRDRTAFGYNFVETVARSAEPFVRVRESLRTAVRDAFTADDPSMLLGALELEAARAPLAELASTRVPILYVHSPYDAICSHGPAVEILEALPADTPRRVIVAPIGHELFNEDARTRTRLEFARWLEHYLWGCPNGAADEPPYELHQTPPDADLTLDPGFIRPVVHEESVEPADVNRVSWRLGSGETMAAGDRALPVSSVRIEHRVDPSLTPAIYIQDANIRRRDDLLSLVPLSEQLFVGEPLATDMELIGVPRVSLMLRADSTRCAVAAVLEIRRLSGETLALSDWGVVVRDASPTVWNRVEFDLSPVAAWLPQGSVLCLRLRNLWLHGNPWDSTNIPFGSTPLFANFDLDVEVDGSSGEGSILELPFRPVQLTVAARGRLIDLDAPMPVELDLRGGLGRAGDLYVLATSFVPGPGTGLPLPGGKVLPLQADVFTELFFGIAVALQPEAMNFVGVLDASGAATATIDLSTVQLPEELRFSRIRFAPIALRSDGTFEAGGFADLLLR